MIKSNEPVTRPALYSISSKTLHGKTEKIYTLLDTMPPASKPRSRELACLDAISEICQHGGCAKVKEIAKHLGITTTTATTLLCRLEEKHLIIYQRHKGAYLTPDGTAKVAENLALRKSLYDLLTMAGVPDAAAQSDAETLNRELSEGTLKTLSSWIQELRTGNTTGKKSGPAKTAEKTRNTQT
ncbi:MAG: MarR family transcriptional regulator [Methanocorpusculum sp.]|nr:MarR family transcriptional regulator [Methanocorpusculum sp.]MDE2521616.1 MarR family transcriptional regulator [Methanocorpusculum sp.]MDE2525446.1 MarR family transcriptional regulator [Methanocorpusculum sp.]